MQDDQNNSPFQPTSAVPTTAKPPMPEPPSGTRSATGASSRPVMMDGVSPSFTDNVESNNPDSFAPQSPDLPVLPAAPVDDSTLETTDTFDPTLVEHPTKSGSANNPQPGESPTSQTTPGRFDRKNRHAPVSAVSDRIVELTDDPTNTAPKNTIDNNAGPAPVAKTKKPKKAKVAIIILAILAIGGIGAAIYFYIENSDAQSRITDTETQVDSLQQQLANSTTNSADISEQLTSLEADKKKLQADLEKAQTDLKKANEDLAKTTTLSDQVTKLTAEKQALTSELAATNARIDRLVAALKSFTTNIPN